MMASVVNIYCKQSKQQIAGIFLKILINMPSGSDRKIDVSWNEVNRQEN